MLIYGGSLYTHIRMSVYNNLPFIIGQVEVGKKNLILLAKGIGMAEMNH